MSQITWNLPDDLIVRLRSFEAQLPQILELGLRELNASSQKGLNGVADLLEFLASLPSPEEILALHPSEALQNQINVLLEKNRAGELRSEDKQRWEQYEYLEHLVRLAKAKAYLKLKHIKIAETKKARKIHGFVTTILRTVFKQLKYRKTVQQENWGDLKSNSGLNRTCQ